MDLGTMFDFVVERTPDRLAIVDGDQRLTYAEWRRRVDRLANGLRARGVRPGDRVLIGLRTGEPHATLFLALQKLGAVAVPFNPRLKEGGVAYHIQDAEPCAVVFEPLTCETVLAATRGAPVPLRLFDGGRPPAGVVSLAQLVEDSPDTDPGVTVDDSALSVILYTSGTTGQPKGVPITHRTGLARMFTVMLAHGLRHGEGDRFVGAMPLYHTIGLHGVLLPSLYLNATYYAVRDFVPSSVLDLIEREHLTFLFASPTHFHMLLSQPDFTARDVRSVRDLVYAGAPMARELLQRVVAQMTANLTHIYGNTEAYVGFYFRNAGRKPGALRMGVQSRTRIVRLGGGPEDLVEPGREGELIADIRADEAFAGYWHKPQETARAVRDGWYFTGDVAYQDAEGDLFITGRVDDMIISGGENIHPAEVEDVLLAHPKVRDAAVVGLPHERWGQVVVACVARADASLDEAEVDRHCLQSRLLPDFKRPRQVFFIEEIPRNASGKVLRFQVREWLAQHTPTEA